MPKIFYVFITAIFIFLNGCSGNDMDYYKDTTPKLDIKTYFNGPIKAWGIVQDRGGKVISRFDVDMLGTWEGDKGILKEDFKYYSGDTQHRTWYITKLAENKYEGKADDIIDKATGGQNGSAASWDYVMDVPVDGSTYRLRFDDRMWLMNDGVLINRSYLKKWGFTVAELTIFMQKQPQDKTTD